MPTIIDSTVLSGSNLQTHTSTRPIILSNGWIVVGFYNVSSQIKLQVSKDNGNTFQDLCYIAGARSTYNFSLTCDGTKIYVIYSTTGSYQINLVSFDASTVANIDLSSTTVLVTYTGSSDARGIHAVIENGLLHLTFSYVVNTTNNIFYKKGTITGLTVAWGTNVQLTNQTTTTYANWSPEIVAMNGKLTIVYTHYNGNPSQIHAVHFDGTSWTTLGTWITIHSTNNGNDVVDYPSVIYVPSSINDLPNGRIWCAWGGEDAVDTTTYNIMISYSDDLGKSWSPMRKLTSTSGDGNERERPSLTYNKLNEVYIVYAKVSGAGNSGVGLLKWNGNWSTESLFMNKAFGHTNIYPTSILNSPYNFTSPLFAYRDGNTKIGFYGTWSKSFISMPVGDIGNKTSDNKSNFFTYTITNTSEMATITEKINGVVIATKNPSSGQEQTVILNDAEWNAIPYGRTRNTAGEFNQLTIEMGTDIFVYNFNKQLASKSKIEEVFKAVDDIESIFFPSIKQKLIAKIGGSPTDNTDTIIKKGQYGKKYKKETFIQPPNVDIWTVNNLGFIPNYIIISDTNGSNITYNADKVPYNVMRVYNSSVNFSYAAPFQTDSFSLARGYTTASAIPTTYIAFE